MADFAFAKRPTGEPIRVSLDNGFLGGVFGGSGSGKSVFTKRFLLEALKTYHERLQVLILDPKRVGFEIGGWGRRCYIYSDPLQFGQVLTSLLNEVDRRYLELAEKGLSRMPDDREIILLVCDELPMVTGNAMLTDKQQKAIQQTLVALCQRARQSGVALLLVSQTAATAVLPNAARASIDQRFVFRLASEEEVKMASAGRVEECPANTLYLDGEGYHLTNRTQGLYVRGRVRFVTSEEEENTLAAVAGDKRYLYMTDWDNIEFTG